jgi:hypothetical protein
VKFLAEDGEVFDTAEACAAHEATLKWSSLVGLAQEDVDAAFADPVNHPLAALIERKGRELVKARVEAGGARRQRKVRGSTSIEAALHPTDEERDRIAARADARGIDINNAQAVRPLIDEIFAERASGKETPPAASAHMELSDELESEMPL